jgi:hypothetical protein
MAACAGARPDAADAAYARQDWDTAAQQYQAALGDTPPGEQRQTIETRLAESRQRAAEGHLQRSRSLATAGDLAQACAEAETAMRFTESDAAAHQLGELRSSYATQLLERGKAALEAKQWDTAADLLSKALAARPSPEAQTLLGAAQDGAASFHRAAAASDAGEAEQAMAAHDWARAAALYRDAAGQGAKGGYTTQLTFCDAMSSAESAASSHQFGAAKQQFQAALATGIDAEYVSRRQRECVPGNYRVTIHGASILPFKPGSELAWDGPPGKKVPGSAAMLSHLAGVAVPGGPLGAHLTEMGADLLTKGIEPPDCYAIVTVGGNHFGSRDSAVRDSLTPTWNLAFDVAGTSKDPGVVQVRVVDRDLMQDDDVGSWETTIGYLVSHTEPWHEVFIDAEKHLRAGGILELHLSVQSATGQPTTPLPVPATKPKAK